MKVSTKGYLILVTSVFVFLSPLKAVAGAFPPTSVRLSEMTIPEYVFEDEWIEIQEFYSSHHRELPFLWCYQGGKKLVFEQEGPRVFLSIDGKLAKLAGVIIRSREEVKILAEELARCDEPLTVWIYGPKLAALNDLADTSKVSSINVWEFDYGLIADISPLRRFNQLTSLSLRNCKKITDLSPIAKLSKLKSLEIQGCPKIADISVLTKLKNLKALNISGCRIDDASPIGKLNQLKLLNIHDVEIKGLEFRSDDHKGNPGRSAEKYKQLAPLKKLISLQIDEYIFLRKPELTKFLVQQSKLISLHIPYGQDDFAPIGKIPNLRYLFIKKSSYPLNYDATPLNKLKKLKILHIKGSPPNFSEVSGFDELTELRVETILTSIRYAQLAKFKNLTTLEIKGQIDISLSDLSPISKLSKLKTLTLDCWNIEDLSLIGKCSNMENLAVKVRQSVKGKGRNLSIASFANLQKLKSLELKYLKIKDITPLSKLYNLESLKLSGCDKITTLEPIANLKNTHP